MRKCYYFFHIVFILLIYHFNLHAQEDSIVYLSLDSFEVSAYGNQKIWQTASALSIIPPDETGLFGVNSLMQAINSRPGIRMEERSPGSYRINIRASAVRSPYGVRNVKIYYDDLPFTAPGGLSMFNLLGATNFGALEIIKGPGGSLYGSGTGGVILISSSRPQDHSLHAEAGFMAGSYGVFNPFVKASHKGRQIQWEHFQSNGYRAQSAIRRDVISSHGNLWKKQKSRIHYNLILSDLYYQTPGGLTLKEYTDNPWQARPSTGSFPGAESAHASIRQRAAFGGLTHTYLFPGNLSLKTSLYGTINKTRNPAIQNFEMKSEPHFGGRTTLDYIWRGDRTSLKFIGGAELQQGYFTYKTFVNNSGEAALLLTDDKLNARQSFVFLHADWMMGRWTLTSGASLNNYQFNFTRKNVSPVWAATKKENGKLSPRFAILYNRSDQLSLYINITKGFSPPASGEIFADNNSYNLNLKAEVGWNFEPGIRGKLLNKKLSFDFSYFSTGLTNPIVTRRDSAGSNYFVNAGKTDQQGLEMAVDVQLFKTAQFLKLLEIKTAYSYYRFKYKLFEQNGNDYSGNTMPGVAPHNFSILMRVETKPGLYLNITSGYTGVIFLNDANTAFAEEYFVMSAKTGYKIASRKVNFNLFAGCDNIFDRLFGTGNDINAFGGRFYNASAGRSVYAGIVLNY